jgi:hypothetical protein
MHILLMYQGGRRSEAVVLAASANHMRVAMPGSSDTVELRLVEGRWMTESGAALELGAVLMDPEVQVEIREVTAALARAAV